RQNRTGPWAPGDNARCSSARPRRVANVPARKFPAPVCSVTACAALPLPAWFLAALLHSALLHSALLHSALLRSTFLRSTLFRSVWSLAETHQRRDKYPRPASPTAPPAATSVAYPAAPAG